MSNDTQWNLWEVFIQFKSGKPHEHVGSVHASDKELAIQNARDVYGRREKPLSIWVVETNSITATTPQDSEAFFDPVDDKPYRYPLFYKIPKGVSVDIG